MSSCSRREFTKLALLTVPATRLLLGTGARSVGETSAVATTHRALRAKAVTIGLNVPYSFGDNAMHGDLVLKNCLSLGVTALELRSQPVETFLGAPPLPTSAPRVGANADSATKAAAAAALAAEQRAYAEALRQWRLTAAPDRAKAFRKQYEDAGVRIEIVKFDGIYDMVDAELDFAFALAKSLGARAISCEISAKDDDLKRVGRFADTHQLMVGYHGHTQVTPAIWEHAFTLARHNAANVDLGHFIAGNNYSPVAFIRKHHDRITHVHIKDRKLHDGPNVPFGQGDTPIAEVLHMIRDNGWPMQATVEFEYPVPAGSSRMTEIARALKYCHDALA